MITFKACSDLSNKSSTRISSSGIGWINLPDEYWNDIRVLKKSENLNENEKCFNRNIVEHNILKTVKKSSKTFPTPQVLVHIEASKHLRLGNKNTVLKKRETKLVEKEIAKYKKSLESQWFLVKNLIDNETTCKNKRKLFISSKFVRQYTKIGNKIGSRDSTNELHSCLTQPIHTVREELSNQDNFGFKVYFKVIKNKRETLASVPSLKKSIINNDSDFRKQFCDTKDDKTEMINNFLEKLSDRCNDSKLNEKIKKLGQLSTKINRKRLKSAWEIWRTYIQQLKNKNNEQKIYKTKIEAFLLKLQEKEIKEGEIITLEKKMFGLRQNLITKHKRENKIERERQRINEEKEEKIRRLIEEAKSSQREASLQLQKFKKFYIEDQNRFVNTKFFQRMERRREARSKRKKEIQEKKRKLEEEKHLEEKKREEENKRKTLEEFKKRRKIMKEKEAEQKREKEELAVKRRMAKGHYKTYLVRKYGLRPWIDLVKTRNSNFHIADKFFERKLMQGMLRRWVNVIKVELELKAASANEFYQRTLKKNCLLLFKKHRQEKIKQMQVAVDWHEFKVTEKVFKKWLLFTQNEQMDYLHRINSVRLFYERKLKIKYLNKLKYNFQLKEQKQEKEKRKRLWRRKVKEILPDYEPAEIPRTP